MLNPIDVILKHEGGYVNDPDDTGGATNFGITIGTYSDYLGRQATIDEVKRMTEDTARAIYQYRYLEAPGIDKIDDPIQTHLLDMAVNHGPRRAIRMIQRTIREVGYRITVDGVLGPRTYGLIRKAMRRGVIKFNNEMADNRVDFYHLIVRRRPSQRKFLRGWLKRARSFRLDVEK